MSSSKFTQNMLQYPMRYEWALRKHNESPITLDNEQKLVLYALQMQAETGPCNLPKPSYFDAMNRAKWEAWSHLGKMSKIEAMRLFVRVMDEIDSNWLDWTGFDNEKAELVSSYGVDTRKDDQKEKKEKVYLKPSSSDYDATQKLPIESNPNLNSGSTPITNPTITVEISSNSVSLPSKLDGTLKQEELDTSADIRAKVVSLRGSNAEWMLLSPKGPIPGPRYRQACCGDEERMYIFGGLGGKGGKLFNDLVGYDAARGIWMSYESQSGDIPSARTSSAICHHGKQIYLFGGQCYNTFLNDFYCFELGMVSLFSIVIPKIEYPQFYENHIEINLRKS
eukprot:TRINITY_DN5437_c0_g1_i2.p1 TRINITY_DN5437_c0_g1~~TRINITY_DN5437_c0_g1_i2.p1  ORF type:complete len:337 (+),score=63.91 TRINITY_DN5437_c0_g1_i2:119-1129(+)